MYVIGDIHGCYKTLAKLYEQLDNSRKIYCVGDVIDRGNNSRECLEFIKEKGILPIIGNHEHMMLCAYDAIHPTYRSPRNLWMTNGGNSVLKNYNNTVPKDVAEWVSSWPYYRSVMYKKTKYLITHSSVYQTLTKDINMITEKATQTNEMIYQTFLWNRFSYPGVKGSYHIIGHTPLKKPSITDTYAMIDGGCVYGHELWAFDAEKTSVIKVKNCE